MIVVVVVEVKVVVVAAAVIVVARTSMIKLIATTITKQIKIIIHGPRMEGGGQGALSSTLKL